MRRALWPRRGWRRVLRYHWRRLQRLPDSPTAVARGFALGAAISMTPFIGLHMWLAMAAAVLIRASVLAAFAGTFVGNSVFILPILVLNYEIGVYLLRCMGIVMSLPLGHVTFTYLIEHPIDFSVELVATPMTVLPLLLPTTLGSAVLGGVVYLVFTALIRDSIHTWREQRRHLIRHARRKRP